jgi:pentose-5-phosphate-3-epimerase
VKAAGMRVGLALNPATPIEDVMKSVTLLL